MNVVMMGGNGRPSRMDRSVAMLRQFEAQHPNGYTAAQACAGLGWSRAWFQIVLRQLRLRSGELRTNTPVQPLNGGNRPWTYRRAGDVASNLGSMTRMALISLAYLENSRAFCRTMQNIMEAANNDVEARRWRRAVRRATFVMEELRDLLAG